MTRLALTILLILAGTMATLVGWEISRGLDLRIPL